MRHYLQIVVVLLLGSAALADEPYGIRAKYASPVELATTNLACGELVANEQDWSDLRMGDGATPGGRRVGETLLDHNMLDSWGGVTAQDVRTLVALSVADQRAGIAENAGNIATNAANIEANAANIYSNSAGLSWVTNAFGQRISEFETMSLGLVPQANKINIWNIPFAELPVRNLDVYVYTAPFNGGIGATQCINMVRGVVPPRPTTVRIYAPYPNVVYGLQLTGSSSNNPSYDRLHIFVTNSANKKQVWEIQWVPENVAVSAYPSNAVGSWRIRAEYDREGNIYRSYGNTNNTWVGMGLWTTNLDFRWIDTGNNTGPGTDMPHSVAQWIQWRNKQPW